MEFEDFLKSLRRLREPLSPEEVLNPNERIAIEALVALPSINREQLTQFIQTYPIAVPLLTSCVGLSVEKLKSELTRQFNTPSWNILCKQKPFDLINYLDQEFNLIGAVDNQRGKDWKFSDILAERRIWSQRIASRSVITGRGVEDLVESVIKEFNVPYSMRTTFEGIRGQKAPCDFAMPKGGSDALIVGAAKGFDSTGSKLTDAVREIESMANARKPSQYVYAIIDGIGWLRRQADLKRIYELWHSNSIDGLYSLSQMDGFREHLKQALQRVSLRK